jgi:hypothetical protein
MRFAETRWTLDTWATPLISFPSIGLIAVSSYALCSLVTVQLNLGYLRPKKIYQARQNSVHQALSL